MTRSTTTAKNTGGITYTAKDRGEVVSAASYCIQAEARAQARISARSVRAGCPARASPRASREKTIIPASRPDASIIDATGWFLTAKT
jgi:hypothetical protein